MFAADRPDPSENLSRKSERETPPSADATNLPASPLLDLIDASTLPLGNDHAAAELLTRAVQTLAAHRPELLSHATRELLAKSGLLSGLDSHPLPTPPFPYFSQLLDHLLPDAQVLASRALYMLTSRHGPSVAESVVAHMTQIAAWCHDFLSSHPELLVTIMRKLVLALREDRDLGIGDFSVENLESSLTRRCEEIQLHTLLRSYLVATEKDQLDSLYRIIKLNGKPNDKPFLRNDTFEGERAAVQKAARTVAIRTWRHSFKFSRYSGETRHLAPHVDPLLLQFGKDAFDEASPIFASSIDKTPGRGFFLSGPCPEQLFFHWPQMRSEYESCYRAYGRAVAEFSEASFCFLRNAVIVHHPSQSYELPVGPATLGRRMPYALYIENDHFSGGYEHAALLPWQVVSQNIAPSLSAPQLKPRGREPADITAPGFNLHSLIRECERIGFPPIMLANISTVFGGSVAGYPKGSDPFFTWESQISAFDWDFDALGRLHYLRYAKTLADPHWPAPASPLSPEETAERRAQALAKLGEGCHLVADAAIGLFNLLDLCIARYDAWKCDLTPAAQHIPRMLAAAYTHHKHLKGGNTAEKDDLVLCRADRYDWNIAPQIVFDTRTLELFSERGARIAFPQDYAKITNRELSAWSKHVGAQLAHQTDSGALEETRNTLILLPREHARSNQGNTGLPTL